jgi:CheY-like chemotaxis protein
LPTWMVVEDEPDIYDVLLAMFEIWGIEGVAFVDGAEAISWIENVDQNRVRGELPELAILDIRLPEVSGPEVGHRLRQSPILGNMAIVLITAYRLAPEEEQEVIAKAQADLLMYKPLPAMPELRQKMDGVIAKHREAKAKEAEKAAPEPVAKPTPAKPTEAKPQVATKEADPKPAPAKSPDKETSAPPESPEKPQDNKKS